jgi:hypothetical protein
MSKASVGRFLYPILGFVVAILALVIISGLSSITAVEGLSTQLTTTATVMASLLVIYVLVIIARGI